MGEVKSALLDGDSKNYDMERGFSRHPIDETGDKGIVVKLGMPCIINRINMLLWDRDQRAYSYCIEVSMAQRDAAGGSDAGNANWSSRRARVGSIFDGRRTLLSSSALSELVL